MEPNLLPTLLASALAAALPVVAGTAACPARQASAQPLVVELYTSEGCSSCPPADRWLSEIARRGDVVALAFHVDYWDRLGWTDRFADPAHTQRQYELQRTAGSRFVYTPQVLVNGRDHRGLGALPPAGGASPIALTLRREGVGYEATLTRRPGVEGLALQGYWAVTEDGHTSQVRAGENAGATLHHDAVVREYRPVRLGAGANDTQRFEPRADSGQRRHVVFVVADASSGRVLQAARLDC